MDVCRVGLRRERFSRTIDDGTNDLVDLALSGIGAREPLAQDRSKGGLNGLEGASKGSWSPEGGSSERPGNAAVLRRSQRVEGAN